MRQRLILVTRVTPSFTSTSSCSRHLVRLFLAGILMQGSTLRSDDESGFDPFIHTLGEFTVTGSREQLFSLPGSAAILEQDVLIRHNYDDINQLLRRIPGIYVREEDGYGLFPNVSIRGVSTTRNSKITVMEDGILTAPAPYASPAAYYTPTAGRMSGLEVIKGSSQIRFGPQTTGGILNYLSTPIPGTPSGRATTLFGANRDIRSHIWYGGTVEFGTGRFGYLVENYHRTVDGFKSIDATEAFPGSERTGFRKNEPMVKFFWEPNERQRWEVKAGYTDLRADETYLGLTEEDFRSNPDRRYAASRYDRIDTEQYRTYLRHFLTSGDNWSLVSTAYYNKFTRSWYKLNDARLPGGSFRNLSEILAGQHGETLIDVLRGSAEGDLRVRNNNRAYAGQGLESIFRWSGDWLGARHAIETGLRWHRDYEDRFQNDDVFRQNAAGGITDSLLGRPGSQDNRRGTATGMAWHLQDRISWDQFSLMPGIRYEHIRYKNTRRSTQAGPNFNEVLPGFPQRTSLDIWTPGIGATWEPSVGTLVFGGVYRGLSVPGPSAALGNPPVREESSLGVEIGVRHNNQQGVQWEVVFFQTDFHDLIVPDNIGGGGAAQTENAGRVRSRGLEAVVSFDPSRWLELPVALPARIGLTLTDAILRSDVDAGGGSGGAVESIFAGGRSGNKVPHVPSYQIHGAWAAIAQTWSLAVDAYYQPRTYGTANNTASLRRGSNADGVFDSRFGRVDRYFLLDTTFRYQLRQDVMLRAGVENLLDWRYVASRIPHGPRPGKPRTWHLGAEVTF